MIIRSPTLMNMLTKAREEKQISFPMMAEFLDHENYNTIQKRFKKGIVTSEDLPKLRKLFGFTKKDMADALLKDVFGE